MQLTFSHVMLQEHAKCCMPSQAGYVGTLKKQLQKMASQRRPHRAPRGGAAFREWHEVLVLAAIFGVAVLLVSTFALYSISDRRITGKRNCTKLFAKYTYCPMHPVAEKIFCITFMLWRDNISFVPLARPLLQSMH